MATPLTAAHRSWRTKVFASTWLSYVGFYFCRKPFSAAKATIAAETGWSPIDLGNIWAAYLIAYALGRPFSFVDQELAESMVEAAAGRDYSVRDFIHRLVASKAFHTK